uniref:Coat protein n=1 Tax=Leviviridae sp. TaxID=2027243 RepID=A0A514D702_9VIRU|nr:MAG: hypothetical protein H3BulkLitter172403_000003 [Leviviridae sp.]
MSFVPTTPITGAAQTGLTTPTYTITADVAPAQNAKQFAVTALGGTQTGVIPHSVSSPFTLAMFRPQNPQILQPVDPVTGVLRRVPVNTYKVITRKGVVPLAGQASRNMVITTVIDVPAGSDTADSVSIRAALSAHFGLIAQVSAGIGDTSVNGIL